LSRTIIFSHFDLGNCVRPHVLFYLQALAKLGKVIFMSTAQLPAAESAKVAPFVVETICRPNIGYDFMSWQTGIALAGEICDAGELVICNDSCYAPIFAFEEMFDVMGQDDVDFWGITANRQIEYHIQSYFMVFKQPVLERPEFWDFWRSVESQRTKEDVILRYEIGLSHLLHSLNMRSNAYFSIDSAMPLMLTNLKFSNILALAFQKVGDGSPASIDCLQARYANPPLSMWQMLLQARAPIVKVNLVRNASKDVRMQILDKVRTTSSYPVTLIERDLIEFATLSHAKG
jgi:rhamnosyltransferase